MTSEIIDVLKHGAGLVSGGMIGLGFGYIQRSAHTRHQRLQEAGSFNNGWAAMPGSMRRVAFLMLALALVQMFCPLLFNGATQWWVSGGVVAGYGMMLYRQLRQRLSLK